MKQLTVISGKGGTGKTSITAALAVLAKEPVIADCDVDAADLHLILAPETVESGDFSGGKVALIDESKCTKCGLCERLCRFDAIHEFIVDPVSCEGCAFCAHACPEDAITMERTLSGRWFVSNTRAGTMAHARLGIAEENSGKLVTLVRKMASNAAEKERRSTLITDGPPGIGCPVIASITGADLLLAVTEPTLSGIHDLKRVVDVSKHFNIPVVVCINKCDINPYNASEIEKYCVENGIEVVGNIKYNPEVTRAMIQQKSVVEHECGDVTVEVKNMWERIRGRLGT
ncbi:MAG: ATP-binding protein [Spirochaetes bacterium]|jgi:MinD superfamily P-loop ATPase|nr:ATP-binding protein [Spirochaetota bacterium]